MISDEVVIQELLKDAKKFKSKWELHITESIRSKPNTKFLKRTLSNIVKTNEELTKKSHIFTQKQTTKKFTNEKREYEYKRKERKRELISSSDSDSDCKIKKTKKSKVSSKEIRIRSRRSCKKRSRSKSSKHRSKHRSK